MRSLLRGAVERVMCALPRRTRPGDRLILAYHNVVPADWAPRGDRSLHLPIDRFEEQLRLIREEAEIVPLMELLTTDAPTDRRVAITFDDAYASALELGVGACVRASVPCTIFVAPGLLGRIPHWDLAAEARAWTTSDRERFLWQERGVPPGAEYVAPSCDTAALRISESGQLRSLVGSPLISIGNHTMWHPNLGALSTQEAREEIGDADRWLRERFPTQYVPVLAYPFGISAADTESACPPGTVEFALGVTGGWISAGTPPKRTQIPRWNVPAGISSEGFSLRLRGRMGSRE
jgi:peptidoglycan/xylan/chitin deacetylase (PgdA/CDA1 family)